MYTIVLGTGAVRAVSIAGLTLVTGAGFFAFVIAWAAIAPPAKQNVVIDATAIA